MRYAVVALLLLAVRCAAGAPTPAPDGLPLDRLPPLRQRSDFFGALPRGDYPAAKAPAAPPEIAWNFSRKITWTYRGQTVSRSSIAAVGIPQRPPSEMTLPQAVVVDSHGDGTATITFEGAGTRQGMEIDAHGHFVKEAANEQAVRELFPIPGRPLELNAAVSWPASFPFNFLENRVTVSGPMTTRLTGWATIGGHLCARLDTDIDATRVAVPKGLGMDVQMLDRRLSIAWFDTVDGCFVSTATAGLVSIRLDPTTLDNAPTAMDFDTLRILNR